MHIVPFSGIILDLRRKFVNKRLTGRIWMGYTSTVLVVDPDRVPVYVRRLFT